MAKPQAAIADLGPPGGRKSQNRRGGFQNRAVPHIFGEGRDCVPDLLCSSLVKTFERPRKGKKGQVGNMSENWEYPKTKVKIIFLLGNAPFTLS